MRNQSCSADDRDVPGTWRGVRLGVVPTGPQVEALAERVSGEWNELLGVNSAHEAVRKLGWTVECRPLAQPGTNIRSLLIPKLVGGFGIVLNTEQSSLELFDWLIAHEFAHSLFYKGGTPPQRIIQHTPGEEDFCDQFADSVTGLSVAKAA